MAGSNESLSRISLWTLAGAALLAAGALAVSLSRGGGGAETPANASPAAPVGTVDDMIAKLAARMEKSPGDPEGWRMLAWSYAETGRFAEAAQAYARAIKLAPEVVDYRAGRGEALVLAANGKVTPDAKAEFEKARSINPSDPRARYFLAMLKDQQGDRKGAIDDWLALLDDAPPGAPWAAELKRFLPDAAREAGIDISARLPADDPPSPARAAPQGRDPTPEQVAEITKLPPGTQQEMIRGMVDGLAERLKSSPRDAEGWIRLMRARMVLGEAEAAASALRDGRAAFADSPAQQEAIGSAAKALGVPGA